MIGSIPGADLPRSENLSFNNVWNLVLWLVNGLSFVLSDWLKYFSFVMNSILDSFSLLGVIFFFLSSLWLSDLWSSRAVPTEWMFRSWHWLSNESSEFIATFHSVTCWPIPLTRVKRVVTLVCVNWLGKLRETVMKHAFRSTWVASRTRETFHSRIINCRLMFHNHRSDRERGVSSLLLRGCFIPYISVLFRTTYRAKLCYCQTRECRVCYH